MSPAESASAPAAGTAVTDQRNVTARTTGLSAEGLVRFYGRWRVVSEVSIHVS